MTTDTATTPDTAALHTVADQLASVISTGETAQAKALQRILIADLRVNSRVQLLPWPELDHIYCDLPAGSHASPPATCPTTALDVDAD